MKRKRRDTVSTGEKINKSLGFFIRHPWTIYPIAGLMLAILLGGVAIFILSRDLPDLAELERASDPLLVTKIYSADGKVIDELYKEKRIIVPIDRIPVHLQQAAVASEDHRFYSHWGVDFKRILKVAYQNITHFRIVAGASTLTQQVARRVYLHSDKTIIRKLQEQLTSLQIERTYSKSEILEMYLNRMTLGRGAHGVQAAAKAWFGKNVGELTIEESAMIVGLFQLPYGYYSPDRDTTKAIKRRNVVLGTMVTAGYLTQAKYDSVSQRPLGVIAKNTSAASKIAPYFCEHVIKELSKKYGRRRLFTDGFKIYTTLDTRVQACADSTVNSWMPELELSIHNEILKKKRFVNWFNPSLETEEEIEAFLADTVLVDSMLTEKATVQVAMTAIDPTNGYILAMIGGRDFAKSPFNRVTQMARQPGSSFKPIVYTTALDNGYPPSFSVLNVPVTVQLPDGTRWTPGNYDLTTGGRTAMREGIYRSLNLVTVRLVQALQMQYGIVETAKRFGLTTKVNPYDATALGSDVVIPLEMVSAFSVFANKGVRMTPIAIVRVEDKDGNIIEESIPGGPPVISAETAYVMTDILRGPLDHPRGTARRARWMFHFNRPAAGKTGTTNDYRNAWFMGFTPQLAAGVWVGFDDERLTLGDDRTGGKIALPIWAPFMKMAHDTLGLPLAEFEEPPNIEHHRICRETYKIANSACPDAYDEVFISGTAPDSCDVHDRIRDTRDRHRNRRIY
ncbi:PBP1A family penicillin-binding protein [bacterium]|nr:PBP1A family penicillin-binding protein [bacterium]